MFIGSALHRFYLNATWNEVFGKHYVKRKKKCWFPQLFQGQKLGLRGKEQMSNWKFEPQTRLVSNPVAEPHSSVSTVADLRTGGRRFDPRLS